jgi:hypothetical protein
MNDGVGRLLGRLILIDHLEAFNSEEVGKRSGWDHSGYLEVVLLWEIFCFVGLKGKMDIYGFLLWTFIFIPLEAMR